MHPVEQSTMTRLATQIRRVRFAAIVALGAVYVLLPASIGAPWLHPGLLVGAVVVFLWLPALETFVRTSARAIATDQRQGTSVKD